MSDSPYTPPKVWTWDKASGGQFANINRPIAGPTHDKDLPVGEHKLQLYSLATPNGPKVTIMLEELLEAGVSAADYDAWLIRIGEGDQFGSGFVEIRLNHGVLEADFDDGEIFDARLERLGGEIFTFTPFYAGTRARQLDHGALLGELGTRARLTIEDGHCTKFSSSWFGTFERVN